MNRPNIFKLATLLVLPLVMWGCFEEQEFDLGDENQLEFAPPDPASGSLSYTATMDADQDESKTVEFTVQLIGGHEDHDRTASVAVDADASEAVEGEHFDLIDSEVVIEANSSSDEVELEIYADAIDNDEELFLLLEIQGSDELEAAPNLSRLEVDLVKHEVEFEAELEGTEDYEDVEGTASIEGNTEDEMFTADISLEGLEEESSYPWAVYEGTCETNDGVVGDEGDYPALETDEEETSASEEAEIDVRLYQDDDLHVRVYDEDLLGDDLVACQDF